MRVERPLSGGKWRVTATAVLAALGASSLALALASAVLTAATVEPLPQGGWFRHLSDERITEWAGLAAAFVGIAVAVAVGGVAGSVLFLAYMGGAVLYAVTQALHFGARCQERLGCLADLPASPSEAVLRQMPTLLGLAFGFALMPLARRIRMSRALALEAVGVYSLTSMLLQMPRGVYDLRSAPVAVVLSLDVTWLAFIASALGAGLLLAAGPSPLQTTLPRFSALAVIFALPLATSQWLHGHWLATVAVLGAVLLSTALIATGAAVVWRGVFARA